MISSVDDLLERLPQFDTRKSKKKKITASLVVVVVVDAYELLLESGITVQCVTSSFDVICQSLSETIRTRERRK